MSDDTEMYEESEDPIKMTKTLSDRQHICPNCGLSMPRDLNASLNILALGLSVQGVAPEKLPALAGRVVTRCHLVQRLNDTLSGHFCVRLGSWFQ